jgi:sugar (pentulose or hexulose) kinase
MAEKYFIGIDGGTQSTKIVMYDMNGNVVCEGKEDLKPLYLAPPDIVEHPHDDLWDTLKIAAKRMMAAFKGDVKDIAGVGVGSIRCCRVLLKKDGTLSAPVINWQDGRTARAYEHVIPETAYVTSTAGYLIHALTGCFNDAASNYFGQWPIDYRTWQWSGDEAEIQRYNIPREMLFNIFMPGTVVGGVTKAAAEATGLPEGLPVVCTTSDKPVEALGAGLLDDKAAVISLGTYIALMVMGKDLPVNPQAFWPIMSSIPERIIYEGYGIRRGMWTVSWFRDLLGETPMKKAADLKLSTEAFLDREAAELVPAGSDGLMTVLDWLANPWEPYKRGIMIGFMAHMSYPWIYRSILEGIAYTLKNNFDAMMTELGTSVDSLIITGGGSNSGLFMQIFADVFGLPARRNVINGTASVGAAVNTAVATGAYPGYEEAVWRMVRIRDTFTPKPENRAVYERLNAQVYRHITGYTDEVLKKSFGVLHEDRTPGASLKSWSPT